MDSIFSLQLIMLINLTDRFQSKETHTNNPLLTFPIVWISHSPPSLSVMTDSSDTTNQLQLSKVTHGRRAVTGRRAFTCPLAAYLTLALVLQLEEP